MGQDPSVIRAEIEETRARVGEEVDALSYKTDVGARTSDFVDEKKQAVKDKLTGVKDAVVGTPKVAVGGAAEAVGSKLPDRDQVRSGAFRLRDTAESNPLGLAVGGVALGFLLGTLLPSTRVENERLGETSDRIMEIAKDTAGDAVERGKQVVQEAGSAALETARESGREQGEELSSQLQERASSELPSTQ